MGYYLERRIQTVENSAAYSIIKALIENDLLVIEHQGFVEWLDRLQTKGEIQEEELEDLLRLANQLQIYGVPRSEFVSIEELPFLEWVQEHNFLLQTPPDFTGRLRNFIDSYLGPWALNSTILGIGLSVTV
ncbi:MAG TPA: hypothetical protein VFC02_01385 [Anaerolineales bacterium]|nr:hypothetical protein [Anaerolineales bacterium]